MDNKLPGVPYVDITVDNSNVTENVFEILKVARPTWKSEEIKYEESTKTIKRGLTNTMVKCYPESNPKDAIMVRVKNNKFEQQWQLSTPTELLCVKYFSEHGYAPTILATFKNGFCYEFIQGEVLSSPRLNEDKIWPQIAEHFAKFHSVTDLKVPESMGGYKQSEAMFEQMLKMYPEKFDDPEKDRRFKELPKFEVIKEEFELSKKNAMEYPSKIVLCHNDVRAENILYNKENDKVHFVDFEVMNYNYQSKEIAAHFGFYTGLEVRDYSKYPTEDFQMKWLQCYLTHYYTFTGQNPEEITEKQVRSLYVEVQKAYLMNVIGMALACPALDHSQMLGEVTKEIDFLSAAKIGMEQYYKVKDEILAMQMPE